MNRTKIKLLARTLSIFILASSAFAQAPGNSISTYPTRMENLLHQTGVVTKTSSSPIGSVEGKMFLNESNTMTVFMRAEVVSQPDGKAKEYGLALQMRDAHGWRSRTTYVDYDELDGLIAGIKKLLALEPELPVVQDKFETKGGLILSTYSTDKREVLARLALNNDETNWAKMSLYTLKDFQNLLLAAKSNLDMRKAEH